MKSKKKEEKNLHFYENSKIDHWIFFEGRKGSSSNADFLFHEDNLIFRTRCFLSFHWVDSHGALLHGVISRYSRLMRPLFGQPWIHFFPLRQSISVRGHVYLSVSKLWILLFLRKCIPGIINHEIMSISEVWWRSRGLCFSKEIGVSASILLRAPLS